MQGIVQEDPEMSFRRGYEQGAIETFQSIQRFVDPRTREVLRAWDRERRLRVADHSVLSYPPIWQLGLVADSRSASLAE
jgi:hypothetical protein